MENEETPKNPTPNMVSDAVKASEMLKAENDRFAELLKKQEELQAFQTLGGKSEGQPQEEKPKELDVEAYAQAALEGKIEEVK